MSDRGFARSGAAHESQRLACDELEIDCANGHDDASSPPAATLARITLAEAAYA